MLSIEKVYSWIFIEGAGWYKSIPGLLFLCFRGESPGCRLFSTASTLEWLRKTSPPPLTGEQYGKTEPKYPQGGRCQSALRPRGVFTSPFIFNNSVETAAPFNVVSHPRWAEKVISGKVSSSCWVRTCDPWYQAPGAWPLSHRSSL